MFNLTYNRRNSSEFSIYITKRPIIPCAERDKEDIPINGSDETLTRFKDTGYKNIVIPVEFNFIDKTDFDNKCRRIKKWLCGTAKDRDLRFSYDSDVFYIVKDVKIGNIERQFKILGKFTANFECSPYAWLNSGRVEIDIPKS